MNSSTRRCANCVFFAPDGSESFGTCRANPPTVLYDDDGDLSSRWPRVAAQYDWCGKFSVRQEEPDAVW
jgi:hypothetical protein